MLFLIGASSIFGFLLAYARVPDTIAAFMFSITTNKQLLLLIMFVIFLLIGTVMDLSPALIIFVPIFQRLPSSAAWARSSSACSSSLLWP